MLKYLQNRGYIMTLGIVLGLSVAWFLFAFGAKAYWEGEYQLNGNYALNEPNGYLTINNSATTTVIGISFKVEGTCSGVGYPKICFNGTSNCTPELPDIDTGGEPQTLVYDEIYVELPYTPLSNPPNRISIDCQTGSLVYYGVVPNIVEWQSPNSDFLDENTYGFVDNMGTVIEKSPYFWISTLDNIFEFPELIGDSNVIVWDYPRDQMVGEWSIPGLVTDWNNWQLISSIPTPPNSDTWAIFIYVTDPYGATGFDYDFVATTSEVTLRAINRRNDYTNGIYQAQAIMYYGEPGCDQTLECDLYEFLRSERITFEVGSTTAGKTLKDANLWVGWTNTTTEEWENGSSTVDQFFDYAKSCFPMSLYYQFHDAVVLLKYTTTTYASLSLDDLLPDDLGVDVDDTNLLDVTLLENTLGELWDKIYQVMTYGVYLGFLFITIKIMFRKKLEGVFNLHTYQKKL